MIEFNKHNEFEYSISYDISRACNNRCSYCSVLDTLDNSQLFDAEMFNKVIDQIVAFRQQNPGYEFNILLLGGEPLLVSDRAIEFISRLQDPMTTLHIFSNFNFKPGGSKMKKLLDFWVKSPFVILCSVHDSSNIEWVKQNILDFKTADAGPFETYLLVNHSNISLMSDIAKWSVEHFGIGSYAVKDIRDTLHNSTVDFTDDQMRALVKDASTEDRVVIIDGQLFSGQDVIDLDFKNIASQYYVSCKINQLTISYDGAVRTSCGYKYESHIDKGLEVLEVFCNKHTCYCGTDSYKKLLRKRDANI